MKGGAVAASTVAFSWEQEPGVSKQSAAEGKKPAAGARRAEAVSRRTPATAKKTPAPAPAALPARQHRPRVPPPPGGPGAAAVLPAGKKKNKSRPREDPFLAAYLACTEDGGRDKGTQKLFGWTGLGLGLGLGLSCKSSCGAVEECVVRLQDL